MVKPHEIKVIGPLLDENLCNHQDVPTDRREKIHNGGGQFVGLTGLDIWWRPVRSKDEILAVLFENARTLGFPPDLREFEQAYNRGYSQLVKPIRERIVCSFVAARQDGDTQSFLEYYHRYYTAILDGGMTDTVRRYELGINRWKSIIKDPKEEDRTWLEYIKGQRWLSDQPQVLTIGWDQPVPALPMPSNEELSLSHFKSKWIVTPFAQTLEDLLRQITMDRHSSPISNIVAWVSVLEQIPWHMTLSDS